MFIELLGSGSDSSQSIFGTVHSFSVLAFLSGKGLNYEVVLLAAGLCGYTE